MAKKYFITGATGLIGSALTEHLSEKGDEVIVLVRDRDKAIELFSHLRNVSIIVGGLESGIAYKEGIDYIIHAAAPTSSDFFLNHPVETIDAIVLGTKFVLDLAKDRNVKSMVNLSSMEVYGIPTNDEELTEDKQFYLDLYSARSSYPMAKRLTETMCAAYAIEYSVPVKSIRLAQVLGNKLLPDDNRVIAQFIRAAKDGQDIKLATDGSTRQTYVSIEDAVSGILTVLEKGESGKTYNLANDQTYCSIREVAEIVAHHIANDEIKVRLNASDEVGKYPPTRTLRLNSDKLKELGWEPRVDLINALKVLADH